MTPEQTERAIEFLLNNQADQDVRLAKLENVVSQLAENQKEMQEGMILLQTELREGIEKVVIISEETQRAVKDVLELEARTFRRVKFVETQVDSLEERVQVLESKPE
jgi:K+/H+ antiporter YhaU regulatory subunit KhtT